MNQFSSLLSQLVSIRNQYGKNFASQKIDLLNKLCDAPINSKKALQYYHNTLLFLIAYPDNNSVHRLAIRSLQQLNSYIGKHESLRSGLYNSGMTNTALCAAFSFGIIKWLRKNQPRNIKL